MCSQRVALMIIRAWTEDGSAHPLRAEIRSTGDVLAGIQSASTVTRGERVIEAVRVFLDDVSAEGPEEGQQAVTPPSRTRE
jgi:hypothetical protein